MVQAASGKRRIRIGEQALAGGDGRGEIGGGLGLGSGLGLGCTPRGEAQFIRQVSRVELLRKGVYSFLEL